MTTPFRSSRDMIVRTADWRQALDFYQTVLGFDVVHQSETLVGFETGSFRLYVEKGEPPHGPVSELVVPDFEAAKQSLLAAGCTIQEEDPAALRCYMRDPYGLVFNLLAEAHSSE